MNRLLSLLASAVLLALPARAQAVRAVAIDDADLRHDPLQWWELEKERWLQPANLPEAIRGMALLQVLAALEKALDGADDRDLVSTCLMALARCAPIEGELDPVAGAIQHLASNDQENRELAALSLGISGRHEALAPLIATALDTVEGRRLAGRSEVVARTRAYAVYGLGLLAGQRREASVSRAVIDMAASVLKDVHSGARDDLHSAAIHALSLLGAPAGDPAGDPANDAAQLPMLAEAMKVLADYVQRDGASAMASAFVPTAIAKIATSPGARDHPEVERHLLAAQQRWLLCLTACEDGEERNPLLSSTVVAIGLAPDGAIERTRWIEQLAVATRSAADRQVRFLALITLARLGGNKARDHLLQMRETLADEPYGHEWATLALGRVARGTTPDGRIVTFLTRDLTARNKQRRAAAALATGLSGTPLQQVSGLVDSGDDEVAAACCEALQLLGDRKSLRSLRRHRDALLRKPEALAALGRALGSIESAGDTEDGRALLAGSRGAMSRLAGATAYLGASRNEDASALLLELLADATQKAIHRAFAAAALGRMYERDPAPWHRRLSLDIHVDLFRCPPTLRDGQYGVLDFR